jgi:phage RecT family recombinase
MIQSNIDLAVPVNLIRSQMVRMIESLPGNKNARKRFETAALGVAKMPGISQCTPSSVLRCIHTCARLNLIPDPALHLAAIVPFRNNKTNTKEATLIIEYRGLVELAKRANPKLLIRAGTVYENDEYELITGTEERLVIRKLWWERGKGDSGKPKFSYCVSQTPDGLPMLMVISRQEGEKIGRESTAGMVKGTPWHDHFERMCEKTAVKRSSRFWQMDADREETRQFREAIDVDDEVGSDSEFEAIDFQQESDERPDQLTAGDHGGKPKAAAGRRARAKPEDAENHTPPPAGENSEQGSTIPRSVLLDTDISLYKKTDEADEPKQNWAVVVAMMKAKVKKCGFVADAWVELLCHFAGALGEGYGDERGMYPRNEEMAAWTQEIQKMTDAEAKEIVGEAGLFS